MLAKEKFCHIGGADKEAAIMRECIVNAEDKLNISGTIDYSEKCEGGTCGLAYERNSGFATVHPVDTIKVVVEQEYQRGRESQ